MLSDTEQYGHQSHARPQERHQLGGFIGSSLPMRIAYDELERIAAVDDTVLVLGESGTGKELAARAVHDLSVRASDPFVIVDCAATSIANFERALFGAYARDDEMGQSREGLVTLAAGGSLFLNEVSELDYASQSLLLRFIDSGVFRCVGATEESAVDVRIIASSRRDLSEEVKAGRLREDLYYRLSTIEISIPALRKRKEDIHLLFRKFSSDFALKYKMPTIRLDDNAVELLQNYRWSGNIRQLRNVAEQISVLEPSRSIDVTILKSYLPNFGSQFPAVIKKDKKESDFTTEREILYKVLFDMKSDLNDLKKLTMELMQNDNYKDVQDKNEHLIQKIYSEDSSPGTAQEDQVLALSAPNTDDPSVEIIDTAEKFDFIEDIEEEEETLSLHDKEIELIKKSLERHNGKRKLAADELGISERTLYRKIKQYDL